MSEWLKEHAWKACVGETLPRVRIPLSLLQLRSARWGHTSRSPATSLRSLGTHLSLSCNFAPLVGDTPPALLQLRSARWGHTSRSPATSLRSFRGAASGQLVLVTLDGVLRSAECAAPGARVRRTPARRQRP